MTTATNSSQLFDCENCGSWVKVRPVCPKCGKEHSKEWIEVNSKNAKIADKLAIWVIIPILLILYFGSN